MKKTVKYCVTLLLLLITVSCSDFLDKEPEQQYENDQLLTSVEGLNTLLNGAYDIVKGEDYYGALLYQYEASKGCDFFIRDIGGGTSMGSEAGYSASSTSSGSARNAWRTIYSVVSNINLILDNIDAQTGDIGEIRRIKGEALALRGLAYFDLMRLFAYPPHFSYLNADDPDNSKLTLGVPIIRTSDMSLNPEKYQIRRASAEVSYNYILEQFTQAKALLEGKASSQGYINAATVSALRMRVLLYMEQWPEVIAEGEEWIGKYESNYSLIPYASYPYEYYHRFNSESIWELNYTESNSLMSGSLNHWVRKPTNDDPTSPHYGEVVKNTGYARVGFMYQYSTNGLPFLRAYKNDVRQAWICQLGVQDHPEYTGCRKYIGDPFHTTHNIPIVRLPEIYLTLAEAYNQSSNPEAAGHYASKVSQARRQADIAGSDRTAIYGERRREYMLEGQNFFDMFRRGENIRNRQYIEMANNGSITFGSTTSQHYRVVYPIPLKEMNANADIRDQQNPGYAAWVPGGEE
ncbi:MAG: RagB/SusD family nutrient uptake outer membrane protein [Alistipes sp.]